MQLYYHKPAKLNLHLLLNINLSNLEINFSFFKHKSSTARIDVAKKIASRNSKYDNAENMKKIYIFFYIKITNILSMYNYYADSLQYRL